MKTAPKDPLAASYAELKALREDAAKLRQDLAQLHKTNSLLASLLSAQRQSLQGILSQIAPEEDEEKLAA